MNSTRLNAVLGCLASSLAAAVLFTLAAPRLTAQERPDLDQLREEASKLEEKARDLKAAGNHEAAREVMARVEALRAKAGRASQGQGSESPQDMVRQELELKHGRLMEELNELRNAGKEQEAAEVKGRIQKIERELAQGGQRAGGPPRKEARDQRPGKRGEPAETLGREQRLRHIKTAVENLHAAGLHGLAERLTQHFDRMQQRPRGMGMGPRGPGGLSGGGRRMGMGGIGAQGMAGPRGMGGPGMGGRPAAEVNRLRAELDELRQNLMELRRQLDGAKRARP